MNSIDAVSRPEDMVTVRELFLEYAAQIGHDFSFQGFDEELATLPGKYSPPAGQLFLAHQDGKLAGCVAMRPTDPGVCEMKRLYVRLPYRGQGLGRKLAMAGIGAARRAGHERMRLDTLGSFTEAVTLYRSLAFGQIAPYYHNPVPGVIFMELDLRGDEPAKGKTWDNSGK